MRNDNRRRAPIGARGPSRGRGDATDETETLAPAGPARIKGIVQHGRKEGRWTVQLEGAPAATVSAEIVERLGLRVGATLPASAVLALREASAALHAYDRALNLLAFRARSAAELRRKLVEKGESAAHADQAIARLVELGLVNDADFARQFTRGKVLGAGASKRRLQQELFRKGIARPVADEAIAEVLEDEAVDEDAIVERVARKKLRSLEKSDAPTRRRRLYAFLARRGYDSDAIRRAMTTVLDSSEMEELDVEGELLED